MKDKEPLRIGILRALTWAAIFVIVAAVARLRLP